MDLRSIAATGLRLGRGTADRGIRLTRRLLAQRRLTPAPARTTTYTPSRPSGPSPATVARNIGPQRPVAKAPTAPRPASVPGAKLPPRR